MSTLEIFITSLGMGVIAFFCRASFMLPKDDLTMPQWLREGLRYAPTAALAAVVAPELLMTQGHFIDTWRDPRLFGAAAGMAFYLLRPSLLGTILCGTGVMLACRFGLGW